MPRSYVAAAAVAAVLLSCCGNASASSLVARQTEAAAGTGATTAAPTTSADSHSTAATGTPTAVSDCHLHGTEVHCMWGSTEFHVVTTATATQDVPAAYTDCHSHGTETFCMAPDNSDVQIIEEGAEEEDHGHDSTTTGDASSSEGVSCHFHAGVEHCVDANGNTVERKCGIKSVRDYNVPLRVGLLFVILLTSSIGVFAPIFLIRWRPRRTYKPFLVLKQFGTGVIISTAFVHLYTHASLMFNDECLSPPMEYEATTSGIVMAGMFLSFLVEYTGKRIVLARQASGVVSWLSPTTVSVLVLEAGIIFHSVLIGITLVVAADSFFPTLFVVILFHQMFEGIALGSRIAAMGTPEHMHSSSLCEKSVSRSSAADADGTTTTNSPAILTTTTGGNGEAQRVDNDNDDNEAARTPASTTGSTTTADDTLKAPHFSLVRKLLLALPFALVTPVGMAIGIGVLQRFDGNDRATTLAIGSLDAVSAGILVWVGLVEMWAHDWMVEGAELLSADVVTTLLAGFGLVSGMVVMSVLGKWA